MLSYFIMEGVERGTPVGVSLGNERLKEPDIDVLRRLVLIGKPYIMGGSG